MQRNYGFVPKDMYIWLTLQGISEKNVLEQWFFYCSWDIFLKCPVEVVLPVVNPLKTEISTRLPPLGGHVDVPRTLKMA
jgi:hypothetical protein